MDWPAVSATEAHNRRVGGRETIGFCCPRREALPSSTTSPCEVGHCLRERSPTLRVGLGAGHLTDHLVAHWGVTKESVRHAKRTGVKRGLPFVIETAFGVRTCGSRAILGGLNFSPILNPEAFRSVSFVTGAMRVDPSDRRACSSSSRR